MKGLKLLLSLMMVFALCGCQKKTESNGFETVALTVTIVDETTNTELYSGTLSASGSELTLEDVLLANEDEIKLVSERSSHGMQIIGLMGIETSNWNAGPWWLYDSINNASCLAAGYCDGASKLNVADGDEFIFTFSFGY